MTDRRRIRTVSKSGTHRTVRPRGGHQDHETYAVTLPPGSRNPERWARATFDGAPAVIRLVLVIGWRLVLRLRPVHGDAGVLGWRLDHSDDGRAGDSVVLSTRSSVMRATLTFAVRDDELLVTGRRELDGARARALWAVVRPVHRFLAPRLVCAAVSRSTHRPGGERVPSTPAGAEHDERRRGERGDSR